MRLLSQLKQFDWALLGSVLILISLGLVALYSIGVGAEKMNLFSKQLIFVIIGFFVFLFFCFLNYVYFRPLAAIFYFVGFFLLLGVLFFGAVFHGTRGWFSFWGINFQPIEFAKLALIIFFAKFFSDRMHLKKDLRLALQSALLIFVYIGLVFFQPDFGSAIILILFWFLFLIFSVGIRWRHFLLFTLVFVLISAFFWFFILIDYQKERILTFLNPSLDPWKSGYNVFQSIIAIGSGEFFGKGLGFGAQSQLRFLPSAHTDFIFAVIAEELGFIGVLVLLFAFVLFFYRGFKILSKAEDSFVEMLVLGILTLIFIETAINIGVALGLAPVIGITLPFISYGGSSLIMHLVMVGILESVAMRQH